MAEEYFTYMHGDAEKPGVVNVRRASHRGDVTDADLACMSLPGDTCKQVNDKAMVHTKIGTQLGVNPAKISYKPPGQHKRPANQSFLIQSVCPRANSPHLNIPQDLDTTPTCHCPDPEDHVALMTSQHLPLSLACPTCWSVQRAPAWQAPSSGSRKKHK